MAHLHIASKPNPTEALLEIRRAIVEFCDDDIRDGFAPHGFTIEPLLMQIIRELQALRGNLEPNWHAPASDVRTPGDAAAGDYEVDDRNPTPDASATGA
jgi:hypothetical protein